MVLLSRRKIILSASAALALSRLKNPAVAQDLKASVPNWSLKPGASQQILTGANDHPLVTVRCDTGTVKANLTHDIDAPGFSDIVLDATGATDGTSRTSPTSASAYARQVVVTNTGNKDAAGILTMAPRLSSVAPGDPPFSAPWSLPAAYSGEMEILELNEHPFVTLTCADGSVAAQFITDLAPNGIFNVVLNATSKPDSTVVSARQVILIAQKVFSRGTITLAPPVRP